MPSRISTDGEPFYCTYCGSGWNEYGACEDVRCQLETKEAAMKRYIKQPESKSQVGNYQNIMRH